MNEILKELFNMMADSKEFEKLDNKLTRECEKCLLPYKEQLLPYDYEKIRDIIFSISYLSKESAFKIGFKTAVQLFLECK